MLTPPLLKPYRPLGYGRVHLPLCKLADAFFYIQGLRYQTSFRPIRMSLKYIKYLVLDAELIKYYNSKYFFSSFSSDKMR